MSAIAPKPAPTTGPITVDEAIADLNHRHLQVADFGKAGQDLVDELHSVWLTQLKPRLAREAPTRR